MTCGPLLGVFFSTVETEENTEIFGKAYTNFVRQLSDNVGYCTESSVFWRILLNSGSMTKQRRSKPKKIQKSSEKHTLISFDSFQITSDIVRSLRCFGVFTSFRWYVRRLANTFIRQKHSVMPYRSIACRQRRILHVVFGILTYYLRFRCHDEANTVFSRNPRNRYR